MSACLSKCACADRCSAGCAYPEWTGLEDRATLSRFSVPQLRRYESLSLSRARDETCPTTTRQKTLVRGRDADDIFRSISRWTPSGIVDMPPVAPSFLCRWGSEVTCVSAESAAPPYLLAAQQFLHPPAVFGGVVTVVTGRERPVGTEKRGKRVRPWPR